VFYVLTEDLTMMMKRMRLVGEEFEGPSAGIKRFVRQLAFMANISYVSLRLLHKIILA
jgi:hypothetical protein